MLHPYFAHSVLALAAVVFFAGAARAAESPSYNFAPVNQYSPQVSASFWNPIIEYVSKKSGVRLNLKLGRTSADAMSYVLAREADFAFTNRLFCPGRAGLGWTVFGRRNTSPVRAQIVVPADSPIHRIEELAGTPVAFPGPEATIAYKVAYAELLRHKMPVDVVFAGNADAVFTQLFAGRVRAAGASSQLAQHYAGRERKAFRVLWTSPPFTDLALMASPRVPAAEARAVARAFFDMNRDPEGARILAEATTLVHSDTPFAFVPATGADYASYRAFCATAPLDVR
ncbi:phosphate/phosphite/phosphonate ABC transporter substrate-binding protein [Massilia sp. TW-1]|uniref:Phosphate/phosphite/phosphonate ABC transporter substrate-binding protein n=1 Tax=Telluria antibiotica TaxID=2717319 RepID=A0ABX0P7R4_9BURK|nr:PhnD/SsuA/transferrin family substrate-binding protein [Telluria antibiotica]NIA52599.1 phosphate/phosphite/phosphonate ABC transporter substrate-binding protein [Telluria antibiotica]